MRLFLCLLLLCCAAGAARADSLSFNGSLDPSNPDDVYFATFTVTSRSKVVIQSYGYGGSSKAPGGTNAAGTVISAGGFDTYFSLFTGAGPSATFLISNDDGGCKPAAPVNGACEDSRIATKLDAGTYTLALTLPNNYSIAENYGSGDLGDGFIDLGADYYDSNSKTIRSSSFAFDITGDNVIGSGATPPIAATPEPASLALLTTGVAFTLTACWGRPQLPNSSRSHRRNR